MYIRLANGSCCKVANVWQPNITGCGIASISMYLTSQSTTELQGDLLVPTLRTNTEALQGESLAPLPLQNLTLYYPLWEFSLLMLPKLILRAP